MGFLKKDTLNMVKKNETLWFFVFKCLSGLLTLASVSIRSHFIDKVTYGNYYLIVQSVTLLLSLFVTWVVESVGRYHNNTDEKCLYTTSILNFLISFIVGFGFLFLMNIISGGNVILEHLPYAALLLFFNGTSEIVFQIYRMSHKTKTYCFVTFVSSVLNVVVFLVLPKESGIVTLLLTTILINSLVFFFSFFNLRVYSKFSIKSYSLKFTIKCLKYSLPLVVVWGCIWIFNSSDTFIINYFYPNSLNGEVGLYNLAHSLSSNTIGLLTSSLSFAVFPKLLSLWDSNDKNTICKDISMQIYICCLLCIPAVFGLASLSPFLYVSLISSEYNPNGIAIVLIVLFSVTNFVSGIGNLIGRPWQLEEKTYVPMIFSVLSAIVNIALDFLFVWLFNYVAAAVVSMVVMVVRTFIMFLIVKKRYKISLSIQPIILSIYSAFTMFVFLKRFLSFFSNAYVCLVIGLFSGSAIYFFFMYILMRISHAYGGNGNEKRIKIKTNTK